MCIYNYIYVCISPRCLTFSSDQFSMDNGVGLKQFKDVEVQPWKFMKVQVNLFMCPGKMAGFPLNSLGDSHGFPPCSHHAELCRNWCNNLRHALRNYVCGPRLKATSISISSFRVIIQYFHTFPKEMKSFGYQNHFDFDGGQPRLPVPLRGTELHASPIKTRRSTRKNHQRCGWTEPSGNKYGSLPP